MVRLTVDIEDGQIKANQTGGPPTVVRGAVSTEASVYKHESLLIGGYNTVLTSKGSDKFPLLGDIPVFGALFRSSSEQTQRRERLFMIRAKVLRSSSPEVDATPATEGSVNTNANATAPPTSITSAPVEIKVVNDPVLPDTVTRPKARVFDVNTRSDPPATTGTSNLAESQGMGYILSSGAATAVAVTPADNLPNPNSNKASSAANGNSNGMWQMVVSDSVQKERDRQTRQILTTELRQAEDDLQKLVTASQAEKDAQKLAEIKQRIVRKRADIAGVKRELARNAASAP